MPDFSGLPIEGGELIAARCEFRGPFRRDLWQLRPGNGRLTLDKALRYLDPEEKNRYLAAFALLVRGLHDRGIDCRCWAEAFAFRGRRFSLRDPSRLTLMARPVSRAGRLRSLARLCREFRGITTGRQRARFLLLYASGCFDVKEGAAAVRQAEQRFERKRRRSMRRWCTGDNADFFRLHRGNFRIYGRNTAEAWHCLAYLLADPQAIFTATAEHSTAPLDLGGGLYLVRRFPGHAWVLRHSGAYCAWLRDWQSGPGADRPLLCLEDHRLGTGRASYLLVPAIP